jgi:hypothetical protein
MKVDDKPPVIEFAYRCTRQWEDLEATTDPEVRFCNECNLTVHYIDNRLDPRKLAPEAKCFAAKIPTPERPKGVIIAGQIAPGDWPRAYPPRQEFIFYFGPKSNLTEGQLATIRWLRYLGGKPVMKSNMIRLTYSTAVPERLDRIISILQKEGISFSINEPPPRSRP